MDAPTRSRLRFAGVQFALIAAGLHLFWGIPRLVSYLSIGRLPDPRPLLFVLSGAVVIAAVIALYVGGPPRPLYAVLASVMAVYLLGYAAWHLGGHGGGLLPGLRAIHHGGNPVAVLADHLASDRFTLVTVAFEAAALVVFGVLLAERSYNVGRN